MRQPSKESSVNVQCRLAEIRQRCGFSVTALAERVGVQRQTIYSIESGAYVPNTAVALMLARELEVEVGDLFALPPAPSEPMPQISARVVAASPLAAGTPVRLAQSGENWLAFPQETTSPFLPEADGVTTNTGKAGRQVKIQTAGSLDDMEDRLLVAGCDPALGLLAAAASSMGNVCVLPVSACSQMALEWLRLRYIRVAGCHIEDPATGTFNLATLGTLLPGEDLSLFTFAHWEEGFLVAPGNPLGVREAGDLANPRLRFRNRELGSGSRALLDGILRKAGVATTNVSGYRSVAFSHLAAARAVYEQQADCCIATSSAARAYQLGFVPLKSERFDLVVRTEHLQHSSVRVLFDALQRQPFRRKLQSLAGYDTSRSGSTVTN